MIHWYVHLSWSHAALVLLAVLLVLAALASLIGKCLAINEDPPRREHPVVDYSARRQEKIAFLGPRYLLARPINRRVAR